jgi:hypothetical protein
MYFYAITAHFGHWVAAGVESGYEVHHKGADVALCTSKMRSFPPGRQAEALLSGSRRLITTQRGAQELSPASAGSAAATTWANLDGHNQCVRISGIAIVSDPCQRS